MTLSKTLNMAILALSMNWKLLIFKEGEEMPQVQAPPMGHSKGKVEGFK
jgi:hypothetical protein